MVSRKRDNVQPEEGVKVIRQYGSYSMLPRRGLLSPQEEDRIAQAEFVRYVTHHYNGDRLSNDPLDRETLSV